MIIVYTFAPKLSSNEKSTNDEYIMLVSSIQSVIDDAGSDDNITVRVYTTSVDLITQIESDFGTHVQTILITRRPGADERFFTAVGHERVWLIPELIMKNPTQSILYLDNDTLIIPGGLALMSTFTSPHGYTLETWQTLRSWLQRIELDIQQIISVIPDLSHMLDYPVINNGAQYYPKDDSYVANDTKAIYQTILDEVGYNYGLDQVAYTIAGYRARLDRYTLYNGTTETVWHAYRSKRQYCLNLESLGLRRAGDGSSNIHDISGIADMLLKLMHSYGIEDNRLEFEKVLAINGSEFWRNLL